MQDLINQFESVLRADGLEPVGRIEANVPGPWPRLRMPGDKKGMPSGRYRLVTDGERGYATYGAEKGGIGFKTWRSWEGQKMPDKDIKALRAWEKRQKDEAEKDIEKRHKRLSRLVTKAFKRLPAPPDGFEYVADKDIVPLCARYRPKTDTLVLPIMQTDKRVWSLEYITRTGSKWRLPGGKVKGGFCPITQPGDSFETVYLVEGYSTGCTIRQATGLPVFVSFNAGNLKPVAMALRKMYPHGRVIIAADNDKIPSDGWPENREWVNTGITKAQEAAAAINGAKVIWPDFKDEDLEEARWSDWNDYALLYGIDAVKELVMGPPPALEVKTEALSPSDDLERSPVPAGVVAPPVLVAGEGSKSQFNADNWTQFVRWKDNAVGFQYDNKYALHNAILFMAFSPLWHKSFVFDEFEHDIKIVKAMPWDDAAKFEWRKPTDRDYTMLRAALSTSNIPIGSNGEMKAVIEAAAHYYKVHPVRDYLATLQWDGDNRLDTWLERYVAKPGQNKEYLGAIGACFLKAAVMRVFKPGCKFDHMLVLEGEQGAYKSSLLEELATHEGRAYFQDKVGFKHIGDKHLAVHLMGRLILEFAELKGLVTQDRETIKAWITNKADEWQPKFSNELRIIPRQFVLAGTTNEGQWMSDPTGGRRFWPVKTRDKIDIEGVRAVKTQLWAEAVARVMAGETHYIPDDDPIYKAVRFEQAARFDGNMWHEIIAEWAMGKSIIRVEDVMKDVLFMPVERWNDHKTKTAIADVLKTLGYESKTTRVSGYAQPVRRYIKPTEGEHND